MGQTAESDFVLYYVMIMIALLPVDVPLSLSFALIYDELTS
jgi:hypothetical protein